MGMSSNYYLINKLRKRVEKFSLDYEYKVYDNEFYVASGYIEIINPNKIDKVLLKQHAKLGTTLDRNEGLERLVFFEHTLINCMTKNKGAEVKIKQKIESEDYVHYVKTFTEGNCVCDIYTSLRKYKRKISSICSILL